MTYSSAKTIAALIALTTVCFGSTAHAADAFNKFPQPAAATSPAPAAQTPDVTTYAARTTTRSAEFAPNAPQVRRVNRVVEPVTTGATYAPTPDSSSMTTRFNKMVTQNDTTSREMPVLDKRVVFTR